MADSIALPARAESRAISLSTIPWYLWASVIGVTSASAAPGSKYGRARYHLIRIARAGKGWTARVELRAIKADLSGCEPDGELTFHSGAANAVLP